MKMEYPTLQVLAVALAAYEHNNNRIERDTIESDDHMVVANRQLIKEFLQGNHSHLKSVSKKQMDEATAMINYLSQTVIMQTLINRQDQFLQQINQLLGQATVRARDFGILAWAPKLVADYRRRDEIKEATARYEHNSQHVGQIGSRISTEFTLLESRYVKSMNSWTVLGHDHNGNLIFYWARDEKKICTRGAILGRVKSHGTDKYRGNAMVTTLHYVKVT